MLTQTLLILIALLVAAGAWRLGRWHWRPRLVMPDGLVFERTTAGLRVLLDVRTAERYRGEAEPIDRVAGHVPGAVNLPMADVLAADGTFLPPHRIRNRAAEVGVHLSLIHI